MKFKKLLRNTRHKISNQQKKYYEKNRDKLIQKQKITYKVFREEERTYVHLQNI